MDGFCLNSLATIQSHDHTQLQGRLGNARFRCLPPRDRERRNPGQLLAISDTDSFEYFLKVRGD